MRTGSGSPVKLREVCRLGRGRVWALQGCEEVVQLEVLLDGALEGVGLRLEDGHADWRGEEGEDAGGSGGSRTALLRQVPLTLSQKRCRTQAI